MENGKSKSRPKDFLHPLPPTWLIHPPVFRLIGSRIHSPLPLPDSISRLIKDRWSERTHPERSSPLLFPSTGKRVTRSLLPFRETSKSIMIFLSMIWKKGETPLMRKLQFAETLEFASWPFDR